MRAYHAFVCMSVRACVQGLGVLLRGNRGLRGPRGWRGVRWRGGWRGPRGCTHVEACLVIWRHNGAREGFAVQGHRAPSHTPATLLPWALLPLRSHRPRALDPTTPAMWPASPPLSTADQHGSPHLAVVLNPLRHLVCRQRGRDGLCLQQGGGVRGPRRSRSGRQLVHHRDGVLTLVAIQVRQRLRLLEPLVAQGLLQAETCARAHTHAPVAKEEVKRAQAGGVPTRWALHAAAGPPCTLVPRMCTTRTPRPPPAAAAPGSLHMHTSCAPTPRGDGG